MSVNSQKEMPLKYSSVIASITTAAYFIYPLSVLYLYKIFFLISFFGVTVFAFQTLSTRRLVKHQTQSFLVFFLIALSSCFWGQSPSGSLFQLFLLSPFFFIFYLTLASGENLGLIFIEKIVLILPILLFIISFAMVIQYGTLRPESYADAQLTGQGTGSFSNVAPALVEGCYPFILGFFLTRRNKVLLLASLLASLFVIVVSQSRGALMTLGLFAILAPVFFSTSVRKQLRVALISSTILFSVLTLLFFVDEGKYGSKLFERYENSQLLSLASPDERLDDYVRAVMTYEGVNAIKEHPWLGIGYGGLADRIEKLYGFQVVSHNIIITAWGEMGVLGIISFTWLILMAYRRLLRHRKMTRSTHPEFYFVYSAAFLALTLLIFHGFARPLLSNPMFYFVLTIAFMRPLYRSPSITS